MNESKNHICRCEECGKWPLKNNSVNWYQDQISQMLKLPNSQKREDGSTWWRTWKKEWFVNVHAAVYKLTRKKHGQK